MLFESVLTLFQCIQLLLINLKNSAKTWTQPRGSQREPGPHIRTEASRGVRVKPLSSFGVVYGIVRLRKMQERWKCYTQDNVFFSRQDFIRKCRRTSLYALSNLDYATQTKCVFLSRQTATKWPLNLLRWDDTAMMISTVSLGSFEEARIINRSVVTD